MKPANRSFMHFPLVAWLLSSQVGPAYSATCEELPKPSVTLKRLEEKLTFNHSYSYQSLTNIGFGGPAAGKWILGLTRGSASTAFSLAAPSIIDPTGRWECLSPQISINYGFSPVTVYVAKEFPPGSCAHKEILEHEMRHAKTYQDHIVQMEKALQSALTARFSSDTPWRGPAGQMAGKINQEMEERWLPFIQRSIKEVDEAQKRIDTDEEYERISNACNGEVKKIIGSRKRG